MSGIVTGSDAAFEFARSAGGDVLRMRAECERLRVIHDRDPWFLDYTGAVCTMLDALLPDDPDVEMDEWLATHEPDEADAQAVEALLEGALCSTVRLGLGRQG